MARQGYFAYITPVDRPGGRPGGGPVDPGYGVDEGPDPGWGWGGSEHPDQGLPGGGWGGGRPGHLPARPGRPVDPGWGWGGGERPGHGLPRPPHVWPKPPGGGLPVDPDWGVGGGEHPDQGPIYPVDPAHPDNALPPVEGEGPPPTDPPPGTIWPPLPPEIPAGKVIALVAISGIGYRYAVLTVPPPKPDQGGPRPGAGTRPDQGLPPTAAPKRV